MLPTTPTTVNLDGREVPPASMLTKGVAVAVDLCLTVAAASLAFYLVSMMLPLDDVTARTPVWFVLGLSMAYLVFGRDFVASPGRHIMRLVLVRLPGNVPGLFGRSISVHIDEDPGPGNDRLAKSMLVVALATVLALLGLAGALTKTRLYVAVQEHAVSGNPVEGLAAPVQSLSTLPRALLMNRRRGYVQVDGETASGRVTLEFFARRQGRRWAVVAARRTTPSVVADFSLGAPEADIPAEPK